MQFPPAAVPVSRLARRGGEVRPGERVVPEETPVAFTYGGTTHAVMMATPADLEDFAVGFSLSEGIIAQVEDIQGIEIVPHGAGIDVQVRLVDGASEALRERRRHIAGPVGCGLCGIESIEQALRPIAKVRATPLQLSACGIVEAVRQLSDAQRLNSKTAAVHGAGFFVPGEGLSCAREDVGRHNALDKLAGAVLRGGRAGGEGIVAVTSRVSVEMVQKTASLGAPVLVAVSAPTALAIRTADAAGMTLVAIVRGEDFEVFTHPGRISGETVADVA